MAGSIAHTTTILHLPTELLGEIFRFAAFSQPVTNVYHLRSRRTWLSLTHVCMHWRNISLEDPCLWSNVVLDIDVLPWGKEFLRRARGAMVDVSVRSSITPRTSRVLVPTLQLLETAKIISTHIPQIRSLQVHLLRGYDVNYLLESLVTDAKPLALMNLHVEVFHESSEDHLVTLPAAIRNEAPIQDVHINCLFFDWTSMVFTGLIHLSLQRQDRLCAPSMETFLQVLKNSPSLETLSLIDAGPLYDSSQLLHEPVKLPNLHRLTLKNWSVDVKYVLQYLDFPTSTKVALTYTGSGEKYSDISDILPPSCASLIQKASSGRMADIRLLGTDHVTGRLEVHCDEDAKAGRCDSGLSIAVCSMYALCLVEPLVTFFSKHTEALTVHQPSSSSLLWLEHLHRYSELTTLNTDADPEKLVSVLNQTGEEMRLICPRLSTVVYAGKYFILSEDREQQILRSLESRVPSGSHSSPSINKEVLFRCAHAYISTKVLVN